MLNCYLLYWTTQMISTNMRQSLFCTSLRFTITGVLQQFLYCTFIKLGQGPLIEIEAAELEISQLFKSLVWAKIPKHWLLLFP